MSIEESTESAPRRPRSRSKRLQLRLTALTLAAALSAFGLRADAVRLTLDPSVRLIPGEYKGRVELVVVPPFGGASISIAIDGTTIAPKLTSPHRLTIDLGNTAVEHRFSVIARSPDRSKTVKWHHLINRGKSSFRVSLVSLGGGRLEAKVSASSDDPVVAVEFYDDSSRLARLDKPPYVLDLPSITPSLIYVTAKARSGLEATDLLQSGISTHMESYEVRSVPIVISVVDRQGRVITDLDRTSFRIMDNNKEGRIMEFGKAATEPISVAVVLDGSASMFEMMPAAREAASTFVSRTIRKDDRCAVFSIHDVPRRIRPLSTCGEELLPTLARIVPQGRTAIYDSIASALRELKEEKSRRAVVILTDGQDTASNLTYEEVLEQVRAAGVQIYGIAFGSPQSFGPEIDRLKFIASETGGFVASASVETLGATYEAIENDLRGQYSIRYEISDTLQRNEWRRVKVVVNSPRLTARTIAGYFTP